MAGYFSAYGFQRAELKIRNAVALTVHLGWMVSPFFAPRMLLIGLPGALYDWNPLSWLPFGIGLATLGLYRKPRFLNAWLYVFFAAVLVICFAGSARYLLPLAAPLAFLTVNRLYHRDVLLAFGFVTQLALSLLLAGANAAHWSAYRAIVDELKPQFKDHRVFVDGEYGLRFYAESEGAAAAKRTQAFRPGDLILASGQSGKLLINPAYAPVRRWEIDFPLRIFGLDSPAAYSNSANGFRAFDISNAPADVVTLYAVRERKPALSFLRMNDPNAEAHIVSGIDRLENNSWRWTGRQAIFLLKPPDKPAALQAEFNVPDQMRNHPVTLSLDGLAVATQTFTQSGLYQLRSKPVHPAGGTATVTLSVDQPFRVPGDNRELALILTAIGFVP
jgi:hypothetical protein